MFAWKDSQLVDVATKEEVEHHTALLSFWEWKVGMSTMGIIIQVEGPKVSLQSRKWNIMKGIHFPNIDGRPAREKFFI